MTPKALAQLHAACFIVPRPWSADEFEALLDLDNTILCTGDHGFALGQCAADICELLTLAVHPDHRRKGYARALMTDFMTQAKAHNAQTLTLEVAQNNAPALALYDRLNFTQIARRANYYHRMDGTSIDALILERHLNAAQKPA